jgi:hypothetical protein
MKDTERYFFKGFTIVGGIASILLGIDIYRDGTISEWNVFAKLIDESSRLSFLILHLLVGVFLIIYGIRSKSGVYPGAKFLACQNCARVIKEEMGKTIKCYECGGKLEPLEGFYERHPEHGPEKVR